MKGYYSLLFLLLMQSVVFSDTIKNKAVEDIDNLVNKLVSPVPPKCMTGQHPLFDFDKDPLSSNEHITHCKNVFLTAEELINMGTSIYPMLVKYLDDSRYSYTGTNAACINFSVRDVIINRILPSGIVFHSTNGYEMIKSYGHRKNVSGENINPYFSQYLKEIDLDSWALRAAGSDKLTIRKEYINWCIQYENKYGFVDIAQKNEVLDPYREEMKRLDHQKKENRSVLEEEKNQLIDVNVKIKEYRDAAIHLSLTDGGSLWKDQIILEVISPEKWKGNDLRITCYSEPEDSLWRKVGIISSFAIHKKCLVGYYPEEDTHYGAGFGNIKGEIKFYNNHAIILKALISDIVHSSLNPPHRKNYIIKTHVKEVLHGEFDYKKFDFRVHSPSRCGFEKEKQIEIIADWDDESKGYIVDEMQFN